jgi:predicted phage terminase large subunit-like protein
VAILNTDVIKGFVGSCLLKNFDSATKIPKVHEEVWDLCTSKEKFVAMALPRGHAKSTSVTYAYTLATVLFRERKFVIIVSDSESQACLFLGQIKRALSTNPDIIDLFGLKLDEKGEIAFIKDTESDIIVPFRDNECFRIIAKGSEQKLRGLLWDDIRPDLIICDDMEGDEQVLNKDRREKFKRWFFGALLPVRSKDGIVRYVGTILHMDSMLENLMPRQKHKFTVIDDLVTHGYSGVWRAVKYKAHNPDFSKILWEDRFGAEELRSIKNDYTERGMSDVYSQEYLNIPIDETNAYFKKSDFLPITDADKKKKLNFYIAGDFAVSKEERSDWTAMIVGGMDETGILHITHVIKDRLDSLEIAKQMLALQRVYDPLGFAVEKGQITKTIGPFLNRMMQEENTYINLIPLTPHRTDKISRARSIQARMRAGAVKFDKNTDWYDALESECLRFPRDRHDDQVDALAYLGLLIDKLVEGPTEEEAVEEEYEEEYRVSNLHYEGRSQICGY